MKNLLSKAVINQIKEEAVKRQENAPKSDKRPDIEAGAQHLTITGIELKNSKKTNNAMIQMTFEKSSEHKPLSEIFMLEGNGSEFAKKRLVEFLLNSFKYEIKPCDTEEDVLKELLQFKGKKINAAIRNEEKLFQYKDENNIDRVKIVTFPSLWYTGNVDDTDFFVNMKKIVKPLTSEEKERYVKAQEINATPTEATNIATGTTTSSSSSDDLPF